MGTPSSSTDRLWAALKDVEDPEFLISVVDMGLIVDIRREGRRANVQLTFTSMGCPATDMIVDDVRGRLLMEPDIDEVGVEIVWDPIWSKQRLTPEGRLALLEMGVAV